MAADDLVMKLRLQREFADECDEIVAYLQRKARAAGDRREINRADAIRAGLGAMVRKIRREQGAEREG